MTSLTLTSEQLEQQKLIDEKLQLEKKLNAAQRLKADCENDIAYYTNQIHEIKMKMGDKRS